MNTFSAYLSQASTGFLDTPLSRPTQWVFKPFSFERSCH